MSGVNKVIIIGRLGQDPEMKAISQGATVTRLNVATSENWTDKNDQKQKRTK
jgi:single-strand DNA-binding protein